MAGEHLAELFERCRASGADIFVSLLGVARSARPDDEAGGSREFVELADVIRRYRENQAAVGSRRPVFLNPDIDRCTLWHTAAQTDLNAASVDHFGKDHAEPEKQLSICALIARPSVIGDKEDAAIDILDALVGKWP
jgi:hypothetical protein